jgi:hypothetical protein
MQWVPKMRELVVCSQQQCVASSSAIYQELAHSRRRGEIGVGELTEPLSSKSSLLCFEELVTQASNLTPHRI